MGARFAALGSSANTTALTAVGVAELDDVYVSIDGTFSATGTVEISFDGGTTWESYGSSTTAKAMIGPLPKCSLVRGKNSARASGTVVYAMGGRLRAIDNLRHPVNERVTGLLVDVTSAASSAAKAVYGMAADVWVKSADFVGTYQVEASFDGGTSWGIVGTPAVVASGATSAKIAVPYATHVRITAAVYTSGTLSARYGANLEAVL